MPNYIRIKQINQNELSGFVEGSLGESVALVTATQNIVSGIFESYNDVSGNFVLRSGDQTISGVKTFSAGIALSTISADRSNSASIEFGDDDNITISAGNQVYIGSPYIQTRPASGSVVLFGDYNQVTPFEFVNIHGGNLLVDRTGIFLSGIDLKNSKLNNASNVIYNTGNQTISGFKTFVANDNYIVISGTSDSEGLIKSLTSNLTIEGSNSNYGIRLSDEGTFIHGYTEINNTLYVQSTGTFIGGINIGEGTTDGQIKLRDNAQGTYINITPSDGTINFQLEDDNTNLAFDLSRISNGSTETIAIDREVVHKTSDETISGIKTFASRPTVNGTGVLLSGEAATLPTTIVYTTGNQTISGVKTFDNRPIVNGTGVLLSGEVETFKFTGDLNVSLTNNKTFGRYSNGQTIPASGKTLLEFFNLVLVEPISPTVSLTSNTVIPFNQTSINNILNASNTINSLNSFIQTGYIEYRRGNVGAYINLTGNQSSSFVYTHSLTDTVSNANEFNYRYVVTDTVGGTNTSTLTIAPSFFYRNYLGYSPNATLTFSQLEALSNSVLSDSKSRTISSVSAGAGNYTYYCYRASQGDLSSVLYGTFDVLGSFTKLTDVVGVNSNGVTVTYRVYKSNSTDAFTNASLTFN